MEVQVPQVAVRETDGVYAVAARFRVPQASPLVLEVLTDYEGIPRFLPHITRSIVRERAGGRVLVEQEAVSGVLMVSRRVHLLLDIEETADAIRFRDLSGRSFASYEGRWGLAEDARGTTVSYELVAEPTFGVPQFVLTRVLKRDARDMIERLRLEVEARCSRR